MPDLITTLSKDKPIQTTAEESLAPQNFSPTAEVYLLPQKPVVWRSFFVFIGLAAIVLIYFGIRAIRLKRKKSRKYGVLTNTDMELTPLDAEDEDDMTLFDRTRK
ncbi:DgyrCDS10966 [Dimorphilus gyrociliatus]|uniref:DgyrCDS10966 n=1 Tax=Dimorphilus gyrociliatus TaxID=2664684 RepID=A0A7I8W3U4_9ANNE|nr:DgyrCDS10966 [Dimorphilus gyrociliatus]